MPKNKSDEAILFSEIEIAGIKVKPWSFGKLFDLSSSLEIIIDKIEEKDIDLSLMNNEINLIDIVKVFNIAKQELLKIISITTDRAEEEIKELSMDDGVKLAFAIFTQNKDTIKNAFAPLMLWISAKNQEGGAEEN